MQKTGVLSSDEIDGLFSFSLSQKVAIALVEIERSSTESRFELWLSHADTTNGGQRGERNGPLQRPQLAVEWSLLGLKHPECSVHSEHRVLQRSGSASAIVGTTASVQRSEQSGQTTASDRIESQNHQADGQFRE